MHLPPLRLDLDGAARERGVSPRHLLTYLSYPDLAGRGRDLMPEEELGIVLIVLGVVFMVLGFLFWPVCAVGIVLLVIGIVLMVSERTRAQAYAPYGYPSQPPYAYPPQPPAAGMPVPQAPYTQPVCPVCASPLTWVPQYGRWYCTRCQAYR